ncbi:hypothetical protein AV530_005890 [Patagioenas fasciata monilis]|uniref:Uncharacterized protein n=1 Tax=Patagioenas fasciata monilis TaxID=372326 RepID=A0A1V4JN78_PATFA|nr:hypothetical protein AV530_005890 [Patagioenas fasciata monilis]
MSSLSLAPSDGHEEQPMQQWLKGAGGCPFAGDDDFQSSDAGLSSRAVQGGNHRGSIRTQFTTLDQFIGLVHHTLAEQRKTFLQATEIIL